MHVGVCSNVSEIISLLVVNPTVVDVFIDVKWSGILKAERWLTDLYSKDRRILL